MQLKRKTIAIALSVLTLSGLAGLLSSPAAAQNPGGGRYTVQSAPANPQPRNTAKPRAPREAQASPKSRPARTLTQPATDVDEPAQPSAAQPRQTSGLPAPGERRFVTNEVVIEVAGRPSQQQVEALARRHQLNRQESQSFELSGTTMFRWNIPDGRNVASVIRSLEADNTILSVQPNYRYMLQQSKNADGIQYAVEKLRLPRAHQIARGDAHPDRDHRFRYRR